MWAKLATLKQRFSAITAALISASLIVIQTANAQSSQTVQGEVIIAVDELGEIESIESQPSTSQLSETEWAPDCVRAVSEKGFVQVYNNCEWDLRVKVKMAFSPDSACKLVLAGTRANIAPHTGRIDGIEKC